MKRLCQFTIKLTLSGPILTKSTAPSSFGLDAAVARDFRTGKPCLPGTLIKGKVRESLSQLGEKPAQLDVLFGKDTDSDSGNEPSRGLVIIEDLITECEEDKLARISRVAIDHCLGSAKGAMLRVIETPFRAGKPVTFTGRAACYCDDGNGDASEIKQKLLLGLSWLTQSGALRTTGFGRVTKVEVDADKAAPLNSQTFSTAPLALDLTLLPQGPLCISRHKIGGNLFESDDIVPGNMLGGAIMETAKALGITIPHFDAIRFRHAFPTTGSVRPRTLPLSTVKAGKIPYDIARFREPVLLKDDTGRFTAPAFPLDWKEHGDVLTKLGWAKPARELRVRTAIDSEHRRADRGANGASGKLFAWEMVHPVQEEEDGAQTPIVWRTRIDLQAVLDEKERQETATKLAQVLDQLGFVSKTKALCKVETLPVTETKPAPQIAVGSILALVLESPALLADPRFQGVANIPKSGALEAKDMLALYREVWDELSGQSLQLTHHFAQQFLAGGNHLAKRFQKKRKAYDPWLLTAAGSVFVFTVKNADAAKAKLTTWLSTGLPLADWAHKTYAPNVPPKDWWQSIPYIPQNGFGEIALHQPEFATPETRAINRSDPILP